MVAFLIKRKINCPKIEFFDWYNGINDQPVLTNNNKILITRTVSQN